MPPNARRNGNDVFGTKDLRGDSFVGDGARFANGFFGEAGSSEKLNRETADEQMLALDPPAVFLEVRVNRGNAGGQSFVRSDEDDVASQVVKGST